ncbi:hypothetical protein ACFE04_026921 [Oxalis oulophora]
MASSTYFPLRWESTGDQWWYATPIDCAAADGLYDVVRQLLHIDANLLIKLTSLRRITRLETVWDDQHNFNHVANCRSQVARKLLAECHSPNAQNTLITAGYGASAGDLAFVKELLDINPLLVFGEGEYGITDLFYAAARSKTSQVFRLFLHYALLPRCTAGGGGDGEHFQTNFQVFKWEIMNRTLHAAARGGNLELLKDLMREFQEDVFVFKDAHGSTILHSAAGRGQVQIVKDLIASFEITNSTDNQGNIALHVAAYKGHLAVVELLISAAPSLTSATNNFGNTFLHMAVAGFRAHGFRRVDRHIELIKKLITGEVANIQYIINMRNNDGKTALHLAVVEKI